MPKNLKEKVRLHILSSFNGCLCLWCGNTHSYNRSIRTYTILLMSPHTKPSRATGTHRILLLWLGSEILQRYLSSIDRTLDFYDDETGCASSAIFYMQRDVGFHHINYVAGKVDSEAAVNCRVEQTEEGPMLSLMSIGCTRSKRLFWRRPTPKQLKRLKRDFWRGAMAVLKFLHEGWIWTRSDALG